MTELGQAETGCSFLFGLSVVIQPGLPVHSYMQVRAHTHLGKWLPVVLCT